MTYDHNSLRFGVNQEKPSLESTSIEDTIYAQTEKEFIGHEFVFNIIGSSHYIYCEDIPYYEISSCKPVDASSVYSIRLNTNINLEFKFTSDDIQTEIKVKSHELNAFDTDKTYDLQYKFAENAYTTINLNENSYTTWHTYPEFDLALFTETLFFE